MESRKGFLACSLWYPPTLHDATSGVPKKLHLTTSAEIIPYWWLVTTQIWVIWVKQTSLWPISLQFVFTFSRRKFSKTLKTKNGCQKLLKTKTVKTNQQQFSIVYTPIDHRNGVHFFLLQHPFWSYTLSRQFCELLGCYISTSTLVLGCFPFVRTSQLDHYRTSYFGNGIGFFQGFLLKNHLRPTYYLGFDRSSWIVLINSEILIMKERVLPVSSDKWKAPLNILMVRV